MLKVQLALIELEHNFQRFAICQEHTKLEAYLVPNSASSPTFTEKVQLLIQH